MGLSSWRGCATGRLVAAWIARQRLVERVTVAATSCQALPSARNATILHGNQQGIVLIARTHRREHDRLTVVNTPDKGWTYG